MFISAAVTALILYIFLLLKFTFYSGRKYPVNSNIKVKSVSVIIAAKNEEENIEECIESVLKSEYPENKMEIIVVDDNSADNTYSLLKKLESRYPGRLKLLQTPADGRKIIGKANAVDFAICNSSGEIIMITDADCRVNNAWVKKTAGYFTTDVKMVCGYTQISGTGLFDAVQGLDLLYLLTIASGNASSGKPVSCIGNNMAFTREAYNAIGGFEKLGFSVTEDQQLLKAVYEIDKTGIVFPSESETVITTKPLKGIKEFISQRKRWGKGGMDTGPYGLAMQMLAFFLNVSIIISAVLYLNMFFILLGLKLSADTFLLIISSRRLSIKYKLRYIPLFELFNILYICILPFLILMDPKISWKGEKY